MDSHHRIARRILAEHQAIAEHLCANRRAALDCAMANIARWSDDFHPERRPDWLVEWERLLTGPLETLIGAMTADTDTGTHLRETSPFVGFLTFQERLEILRRVDPEIALTLEAFGASWDERFPAAADWAGR